MPWDEQPPTAPPKSLERGWDRCKTPHDFDSWKPYPIAKLSVRSLRSKEPVAVTINETEATVADVKAAFVEKLMLSSRKYVLLRWLGVELDDAKTLSSLKIPDGTTLDAAFRPRSVAEVEALKNTTHVLVVDIAGQCGRVPATPTTLVRDLKAQCKLPQGSLLCFAQHYTSGLGMPLADDKTLAACDVVDGDVLVSKPDPSVPVEPAGKADAKPAKKK